MEIKSTSKNQFPLGRAKDGLFNNQSSLRKDKDEYDEKIVIPACFKQESELIGLANNEYRPPNYEFRIKNVNTLLAPLKRGIKFPSLEQKKTRFIGDRHRRHSVTRLGMGK